MIKKIYRGMERLAYCIRILKSRGIYFFKYHTMDGFEIEGNVRIEKHVDVFFWLKGRIRIQDNSLISKYSKIVINGGDLYIGRHCTFGRNAIFNVFDTIRIEDNVLTADKVSFIGNLHTYEDIHTPVCNQPGGGKPIEIGAGTWIGINAVILAGTKIGKNCVVGANAVVKGEFPDYCVIAGVPAVVVKKYDFETESWIKV